MRLVNRTTRRLALTPEGDTYFQSGRRLIEEFKALESGVAASSGQPRGLLRVNTGLAFGLHQLAPVLGEFQARYPEIRIDLSLTDRVVDLHAEQVDVAIRSIGSQRDSSLMARKLADTQRVICASDGYLDRFGHPKRPADLAHHRCIVVAGSPDGERWPFRMPTGGIEYVDVGGPIRTDNSECALQLALAGTGIIRIGELLVGRAIAEGRLVPLLTDVHKPEKRTTWAVFPAGMQTVPRVRVFLDFLVERFACAPWRSSGAWTATRCNSRRVGNHGCRMRDADLLRMSGNCSRLAEPRGVGWKDVDVDGSTRIEAASCSPVFCAAAAARATRVPSPPRATERPLEIRISTVA